MLERKSIRMDFITRYISNKGIKVSICVTTNTIEEARYRHNLWPVVTAALGRVMTGALLLGNDFKNEETVSLTIDGKGPIGKIHADSLSNNTIRGYVDHPHVDLPLNHQGKLDVGGAVGNHGTMTVTRYTKLQQDYTSQSELISGEIGEDLAYYLCMSEQINSAISVGILVNPDDSVAVAGGFLVQALPEADEDTLQTIEENIKKIGPITAYLTKNPQGEDLIHRLLEGIPFKEVYHAPVHFGCTCGRNRFLGILSRLKTEDKSSLLEEESTELVCHYCNTAYRFTKEELQDALL